MCPKVSVSAVSACSVSSIGTSLLKTYMKTTIGKDKAKKLI